MDRDHLQGIIYLLMRPKGDDGGEPLVFGSQGRKALGVFTSIEDADVWRDCFRGGEPYAITTNEQLKDIVRDCTIVYGVQVYAKNPTPDGRGDCFDIDGILFPVS